MSNPKYNKWNNKKRDKSRFDKPDKFERQRNLAKKSKRKDDYEPRES